MDLPWKRHFGVECSCGAAWVTELVTRDQVEAAEKDPVLALRSLSREDQVVAADFYVEHKKLGHTPRPALVAIAALPKA